MKITLIILFLLLFTTSAYSYEFVDPPHYCSFKKLTDCLNLSEGKCIQATERANDFCTEKYNLEEKDYEETKLIIKQVGSCASDQFLILSSINKQQFEACSAHFAEFNKILLKYLREEQAKRDKHFFDEADPLHNIKPNNTVKRVQ